MKISDIAGFGLIFSEKLKVIGIQTDEDLLIYGATKYGRRKIAMKTGIGEGRVFLWVNLMDMMRINGFKPEFALLFRSADVRTLKDIASYEPALLYRKLAALKGSKKYRNHFPTMEQLEDFIGQARNLELVVNY